MLITHNTHLFFTDDIEFYHEKGGVTKTKKEIVESTRTNVCGKVKQLLVEGASKYTLSPITAQVKSVTILLETILNPLRPLPIHAGLSTSGGRQIICGKLLE